MCQSKSDILFAVQYRFDLFIESRDTVLQTLEIVSNFAPITISSHVTLLAKKIRNSEKTIFLRFFLFQVYHVL